MSRHKIASGPLLVADPVNGGYRLFLSLAEMRGLSRKGRQIWWNAFKSELPDGTVIDWVRDLPEAAA